MAQQWYCEIGGEVVGPFGPKELRRMAESGRLSEADAVRRGEKGRWVPAWSVGGLTFAPPPAREEAGIDLEKWTATHAGKSQPPDKEESEGALPPRPPEPPPPPPPPVPASVVPPRRTETVFYDHDGVVITSTRAIFWGKTYAMAAVTSVQGVRVPSDPRGPLVTFLLGGITLMIGSSLFATVREREGMGAALCSAAVVALGLALCALAVVLWTRQRPKYTLRMVTASGETQRLISSDPNRVNRVVNAIALAVVERG